MKSKKYGVPFHYDQFQINFLLKTSFLLLQDCTCLYQNQLIIDKSTESALLEKRALLQREAAELTSYITQNQDISHSLVNICQR